MILARRQGWIGVDFGAHAVKIAQVERRASGLRLVRAAIARRNEPWAPAIGPDTPAVSSADELRVALDMAGGFGRRQAACVVSMRLYDHRGLRVVGSSASMAAQVQQEIATVYGGSAENRLYDYWSVESAETHPNADNLNLLSLESDWSNRVYDDLQTAGLYAELLDGPPLALARAVHLSNPEQGAAPALIVDWGYNRITVSLVSGDKPLFVRCLRDCGYRIVLEAVEKSLGVNAREAQKVLTDFGLPDVPGKAVDDLQHVIADTVADALSVVAGELDRTMSYLKMNRRASAPEAAWLFGGGATLRNADRYLERAIGMRTRLWTLDGEENFRNQSGVCPLPMLGSAIALSALAWSDS